MYSWGDVAARTLAVYDAAMAAPWRAGLLPRLRRAAAAGPWAGPLWCAALVLLHWWWRLLERWAPAGGIEAAPNWPQTDCVAACLRRRAGGGGSSSGGSGGGARARRRQP